MNVKDKVDVIDKIAVRLITIGADPRKVLSVRVYNPVYTKVRTANDLPTVIALNEEAHR